MAIQRTKTAAATAATAPATQEEENAASATPTPATPASGPVPVPDQPVKGKRGGHTGPRLFWNQTIDGSTNTLDTVTVRVAREVSAKYNGRATLNDLVAALQAHPTFSGNKTPDGVVLSDLLNITNVRNRWLYLRKYFTLQRAKKPIEAGGLGLDSSATELSKEQFEQMEAAITKPKDQGGSDFPQLVILRGRHGGATGLNLDDI